MSRYCIVFFLLVACLVKCFPQSSPLTLWFKQPALQWNEALPIGNGRLGAMVFGGIEQERIQLNESSVWTGGNQDFVNPKARPSLDAIRSLLFRGQHAEAEKLIKANMMGNKSMESSYQTLGDLHLSVLHCGQEAARYKRALNLEEAIVYVNYEMEGIAYSREMFSSAVDQVMVLHMTASQPQSLTLDFRISRPGQRADITHTEGMLWMREHVGAGKGVKLVSAFKILTADGTLMENDTMISVSAASSVTVLISATTNYNDVDYEAKCVRYLEEASTRSFVNLKQRHIENYQHYFNRVNFILGETQEANTPTDLRLALLKQGKEDLQLVTLYYQFSRYLLISSSRPGGLPANLQGIWADGLAPPWSADYHININIQMNYWLAESANLTEMHQPFFDFINALRVDGRKTATEMYGLPGAVAHFTTDAWHFTETYGKPEWAMWPMGLTWCVEHLWRHYLFTEDKYFLKKECYPAMREVVLFCKEWLVQDPSTGYLVSGPSISPENYFRAPDGSRASVVMGPTMDHMLIRELLKNTITATRVLKVDKPLRQELEIVLAKLSPTQIGADGRILEWSKPREELEPGHRHISHLYGLYPGTEMVNDVTLKQAARKTLDYRLAHGGGHTGWSRAWIINFYARLQDGEKCYEHLLALFRKSTLSNLFDNHPPFQIDGNFGAAAGINEMLLQSHSNTLNVLPALPQAWAKGHIKGIRAQRGFAVDIQWENHRLVQVVIHSSGNHKSLLRHQNKEVSVNFRSGKTYIFDSALKLKTVCSTED